VPFLHCFPLGLGGKEKKRKERHSMGSSLTRLIDAGTDEVYGVRVEPKVFLANERTFLNWLRLSVTLGSIAAVCVCMCEGVRAIQVDDVKSFLTAQ
jgi:uncharacterized membrane protein YidH (DUF202 family)